MSVFNPTRDRCAKFRLMKPTDVPPIHTDIKVIGTFNPAAAYFDDSIALVVRVAIAYKRPTNGEAVYLTYQNGGMQFHRLNKSETDTSDPRVFIANSSKELTHSSLSYLQVFWLRDVHMPCDQWRLEPGVRIMPDAYTESFGIGNPRCTQMGNRFFITYTSVSRHGASTSLMITSDFRKFERCGVIFPCENSDVVIFPKLDVQRYYAIHRPANRTPYCKPQMWSSTSPDGLHWGAHRPLMFDNLGVAFNGAGSGTPPISVDGRYVALLNSSELPRAGGQSESCFSSTIEFSLDQDRVTINSTSSQPFIYPDQVWELEGFVPRVVFPTALLVKDERALIFYGAADENVAVAETTCSTLLTSLKAAA